MRCENVLVSQFLALPDSEPATGTQKKVCLSVDWFPILQGALDVYREQCVWGVWDEDLLDILSQIDDLQALLSNTEACVQPYFAGEIRMVGATTIVPTHWFPCDGRSLLRTAYAELFTAIGTNYGNVDSTHFNVPDFRARLPMGYNTTGGIPTRNIGESGGADSVTLTTSQLPSHNHAIPDLANATRESTGSTNGKAASSGSTGTQHNLTNLGNTGNAGSGASVDILPRYLTVHYIIFNGKFDA